MGNLLKGKVVLVTGAGSGVGQAVAVAYAANGATVIASDINLSNTISRLKSKKSVYFIETDVTNLRDCSRLINKIIEKYGRLNIAFNSGGLLGEVTLPDDMNAANFNHVILTNLTSIYYCMKYEIQTMLDNGGGIIINSPTVLDFEEVDSFIGYVAAKHGIIGLTQNAALKYAKKNISIHCVAPDFVHAPLLETIDIKSKTASSFQQVSGQRSKAEGIAAMALCLSSCEGSSATSSYHPGEGYSSSN